MFDRTTDNERRPGNRPARGGFLIPVDTSLEPLWLRDMNKGGKWDLPAGDPSDPQGTLPRVPAPKYRLLFPMIPPPPAE